jgi:hypothetical protein
MENSVLVGLSCWACMRISETMTLCAFRVLSFSPDQRQYKTSGLILEPAEPMLIMVDVPEWCFYKPVETREAELLQEIGYTAPIPQHEDFEFHTFTPAGWAYIEDVLLARSNVPDLKQDPKNVDAEEVQWENW